MTMTEQDRAELTYTVIYRQVYGALQKDGHPHEKTHRSAIQITDALWFMYTESHSMNIPATESVIVDIVLKSFD